MRGVSPVSRIFYAFLGGVILAAFAASGGSALAQGQRTPTYDGRIDRPFALPGIGGIEITASNLRVIEAPNIRASRGMHFVGFSLRVRNRSSVRVTRSGRLMEGMRAAPGDPGASATRPQMLGDMAAPGTRNDDETLTIPPGQEHTFQIVGAVADTARHLVFNGTFVTDTNGPNQKPRAYKIDLGTAPAVSAASGDQVVTLRTRGRLDGILVRVLRASDATGNFPANSAPAGKRIVRVDAEWGNPLTASFHIEPLTMLTLENADGTRSFPRFLAPILPDAMTDTDLAPRKQVEGAFYFVVPATDTANLRARFNPEVGHGNVVVTLGALGSAAP